MEHKKSLSKIAWLLPVLAFLIPFFFFYKTSSPIIGLDDAAEFAYTASVQGIPHPPGFPAYIFLTHAWLKIFGSPGNTELLLTVFSCLVSSLACLFVFLFLTKLLRSFDDDVANNQMQVLNAAFFASISFAFGMTVWQWSNAIEIYAFQMLCLSLLLFGLIYNDMEKTWNKYIFISGIALGFGLANHHLTIIVLLPLTLLFLVGSDREKKVKYFNYNQFLIFTITGLLIATIFYGSMMIRAGNQYDFEFGNPDNFKRLYHHLSGGFFSHNILENKPEIIKRLYFFLTIIFRHFLFFVVFLIIGTVKLANGKQYRLLTITYLYFFVLLIYQIRNNQIANTDTYMVFPFMLLSIPVAFGLTMIKHKIFQPVIAGICLVILILLNFNAADKSNYDAPDAVMKEFSQSAPRNSIVLLSNWDIRIIYEFYRYEKGFRKDLTVLRSDVKGANYECFIKKYPEFHNLIKQKFHAYLNAVKNINPDYVYTDYYNLSSESLVHTYKNLLHKIIEIARQQNKLLLFDRSTVNFYVKNRLLPSGDIHPHGLLFSYGKVKNEPVFQAEGKWLIQPYLYFDLCAANILQDYYEIPKQVAGYYRFHKDSTNYNQITKTYNKMNQIAYKYNKHKPFTFIKK